MISLVPLLLIRVQMSHPVVKSTLMIILFFPFSTVFFSTPLQTLVLMLDPVTYYVLLVPATVPVILFFFFSAWMGWQLFVNN